MATSALTAKKAVQKSSSYKSIVSSYDEFLKTVQVTDKNLPFTHTSMEGGKYYIDDSQLDTFHEVYHKKVFMNNANSDNQGSVSIVERHEGKEYFPIICDLDMKFKSTSSCSHCYDIVFVREFLIRFMTVIERFLIITEQSSKKAFVLEKLEPTNAGNELWKDGLHIVFPYIVTNATIQEYIREDLIKETIDLFEGLKVKLENEVDDIIDKSILRSNGWMMYGSKKPNTPPCNRYLLYDESLPCAGIWEISPTTAVIINGDELYVNTKKLISLLSIRKSSVYDSCEITELGRATVLEGEKSRLKKQKDELKRLYSNSEINIDTQETYDYAKKLVQILDKKRAERYQSWMELGWCLHNIDFRLLEDWIAFSKTCVQYEASAEEECREKWMAMRTKGLNIGTLCFWAEMDDRPKYLKIRETTYEGLIRECCGSIKITDKSEPKGSINDSIWYIVRVIKKMYEHQFVCSNYEKKEWWDFNGNIWERSDGAILMRKAIPEEVYGSFNKAYLVYNEKSQKMEPNSEAFNKNKNLSKSALFIANKIRNPTVKRLIVDEAAEAFHWTKTDGCNFEEKLDSNTKLIGMKNGVYDLNYHCFRQGRCDDYISMSTKNDYFEYTWETPVVAEIMLFVQQVLPRKSVRDYVLKIFASCLDGSTGQEKFYIFLGCGGNGKSKIMELLQMTIGDYAGTLSVSAITQNRPPSNAPTPELMRLKGRRFVSIQEPNKKEELQVGRVKELTGGDTIIARSLNKEPIEYKPQFKMFLSCNHCPKVPPDDGGIWRRIRLIHFTSKFVDNPNPDDATEFPRDYELHIKMQNWKEAFFWILCQYYKFISHGCAEMDIAPGLREPTEVIFATNEYRHKNDFIQQFLDYYIVEDATGFVSFENGNDNIWDFYRYYAKQNNQVQMQKQDLIEAIENKYGQMANKKVKGWDRHRFLEPDERGTKNIKPSAAVHFTAACTEGECDDSNQADDQEVVDSETEM